MIVVNDVPGSSWHVQMSLPGKAPFASPYERGKPIMSNRYDLDKISWKYTYENADEIIDSALLNANVIKGPLFTGEENIKVYCEYETEYMGTKFYMYAGYRGGVWPGS